MVVRAHNVSEIAGFEVIPSDDILEAAVDSANNGKLRKSNTPPFPAPYKLPDGPFNTSAC